MLRENKKMTQYGSGISLNRKKGISQDDFDILLRVTDGEKLGSKRVLDDSFISKSMVENQNYLNRIEKIAEFKEWSQNLEIRLIALEKKRIQKVDITKESPDKEISGYIASQYVFHHDNIIKSNDADIFTNSALDDNKPIDIEEVQVGYVEQS